MLSDSDEPRLRQRAAALGADAYFVKFPERAKLAAFIAAELLVLFVALVAEGVSLKNKDLSRLDWDLEWMLALPVSLAVLQLMLQQRREPRVPPLGHAPRHARGVLLLRVVVHIEMRRLHRLELEGAILHLVLSEVANLRVDDPRRHDENGKRRHERGKGSFHAWPPEPHQPRRLQRTYRWNKRPLSSVSPERRRCLLTVPTEDPCLVLLHS